MGVYGLKIKWIGPVKGDKYKFLPQIFSNLAFAMQLHLALF